MVVSFVVVFALVLLAVSVGLKFFDARRKKQVADMLQTASGEAVVAISNLLKEIEIDKPTGFKRLLASLAFRQARAGTDPAGRSELVVHAPADRHGSGDDSRSGPRALVPVPAERPDHGRSCWPLVVRLDAVPLSCAASASKRLDTLEEQFPEALDFLARSMRAGHAFTISLEMLGEEIADPLGQEFRALFNEQNLGAPLDIALRNFTERVPLLDVRFFTSSVLLQKQTGGNLSEILTRLAYVIRERFRLKGQVKAASAHGRLTATILTLLPVATMLGLLVVAPGYLQGMADDPDGK